jgi:hypothetical protein
MTVFRPSSSANYWGVNVAQINANPATAATVTVPGITTTIAKNVTMAWWSSDDDNTWGSLSGTGWSKTGLPAQIRNYQGNDQSMTSAYYIQTTTPGVTGNVSQTQATLASDPTCTSIISFYEIQPPTITSFTPTSDCANAGSTITITGTNFSGVSAVNFNGLSATHTIVSSTSITATVPNGATTGAITITNAAGTATSSTNFTINSVPSITGTTGGSRCDAGTVNLSASASAGTINWYAASTGGSSLGTGTSFTTPSISSTTTYYADATSGSCTSSSRTAVTATVNSSPVITGQPANASVTTAQTATFTVTATGTSLTYQWQEFAGSSWANITNGAPYSGATTATLTITTPSASLNGYKYRCVVSGTCSPTATSDGNATLTVTLSYCSPTYASGGNTDNITNVTLGTLNDTPPANTTPFYFDRTSLQNATPSLQANLSYNLSLTFGSDPNQWSRVWIDFNQNGTLETTESFSAGTNAGASGTSTISISIPANATTGITRMRIRGADDVAITTSQACGASGSGFGQALDYYVNIFAQPACSGIPAPGSISASSTSSCSSISVSSTLSITTPMTESGLSYQWQESTDNSTFTDISAQTNPSSCVITLTSVDKYYRLKVTCANGGGIGYSTSQIIYYDCSNYCTSNASTTSYSYINNVTFNTINNSSSGCASFTNFTNVNTTVLTGQTYSLTITKINNCTGSTAYTGRFAAWIDWNRDGDFADAGEQVLTDAVASDGPVSATVTVPAGASLGSTRMRCTFREGATAAPYCGAYASWGETEDYAVIICANPSISSPSADATVTKCSVENTSFSVTATTPAGGGATTYQWQLNTGSGYTNLTNTGVYTGATDATLNLTGVTAAMNGYLYRCVVSSGCGGSATSFVTTLNVGAAPTASAGGSATICANSTATVSGATSSNGTIAWTENGAGTITSGATTLSPIYTPANSNESNTVTMTMTVTGTNTGCTSTTATATYTVTVNPNPAVTPGSNPSVCQGTTSAQLSYSGMTNGGNQYSIDYNGAAEAQTFTDVSNASTTSSPITLIVPASAASGTYSGNLTVRNSATTCSSTSSYPIQITVNKVDVTIGTAPQVCQGLPTTVNLGFTIIEGSPTQYTIDFDGTAEGVGFADVSSFTTFSTSPIAVSVPNNPATGTYNGTITFRNPTTGCTVTKSFSVIVTAAPQVSNFSLGSTAVCAGFGNSITVTSSSLFTGTYTVTYNVSGANSATGLTSTLNFTAGSPGTGTFTTGTLGSTGSTTVTVTELTSGCSSSVPSVNTTFNVNASPTTPTTSAISVCEGSPLVLSASGSTGTYSWTGPNSYNGTGATPTVNASATTTLAGTYSVFTTDNGCQSQTANLAVTVNTVGITLGTNPSVCAGTTTANLPYSAISGAPSQYSIDYNAAANTAGFSDVSLATLSSSPIVLVVPSNPGAGTYLGTLTVRNTTNGCTSATSYPISVTVNALPTITGLSNASICRGASSGTFTYSSQSGANQYAIDYDATAEGLGFTDVALTSLGSSPVTFSTPTGAPNGTYNASLCVKNTTTGCVSNPYVWTVTLTSPTVTASASPDAFCDAIGSNSTTITASGATTYSWNTGESTNSIVKTVSSTTTYTVTGTSSGCSSQTAVTVSVGEGSSLYSSTFETASECANWVGQATTTPANGNHWAMGRAVTAVATGWYNMLVTSCGVGAIAGSYSPRAINFKSGGSVNYCSTNENQLASTSKILYSPSISSTGYGSLKLTFKYEGTLSANNNVKLQYSTDGGSNWSVIETYSSNVTGTKTVNLPSALNNISAFRLGFLLTTDASTTGSFVFDDFSVTGNLYPSTPNTPTGAVTSRCTNSAITNTYTVSAVNGATSYAWAIAPSAAGTISGTGTTGTVTWAAGWTGTATITAAAVNCAGTGSYSSGLSVTISAQPTVSNPSAASQSVCANTTPAAISVSASGGSGSMSYQWFSNASNSTSGGSSISLATSNSYTAPATGTSGTTYYYCTVSNSGTNCASVTTSATAAITVNPIPVGTSDLSSQSICSGQTTTAVSLYTSNNVTGTTFTWTRDKTSEVTGIANSGSGSSIAASTLINTTLTTQTVVFTITPTGPATTNCVGSTYSVSIVVTPGATVNAGSNIAAGTASTPCKSISPSAISLTGASVGGSASDAAWSITSGTGTLSSTVSSATPGTITYTPGSNESGTVTLTLTTNDPDGGGGCTAVSATKTIFIETPVTITTATDYVTSTTTCGQTQLTLAHDGVDGSGQWEFDANVLASAATDASITVDAGPGTYNTPITATWNATSQCANVTKTIQFNQPVTSSITNDLTSNNSWLWGGLSTTAWGTAANWYKWDGYKWLLQSSATPSTTDRVFMLNNSTAGVCVSASNTPALGTSPSIDDLNVGSGQTLTLNSNSLTINGDLINQGTVNAGTGTVVFNATSGNQTIGGNQPVALNNLTLNKNSGNLIVSTPVTVNGTLTMTKGNISNSSLITLGSSSSSTGTLSHTTGTITGAFRRYFANSTGTNYYFPIGNATYTRGVTVNMSQAPGADQYITAEYKSGTPQVNGATLYTGLPLTTADGQLIQNYDNEGYWQIDPKQYDSGIDAANYTISLQMNNISGVNDYTKTRIIKADGPSHVSWSALSHSSATGSNTNFTLTASGTGFSWFNGGGDNNNNPLPVELVSFSGACDKGVISLTWQTASEFNSSHFDVEKSRDGENWQVLTTMPSAGTSNELITYQSTDQNGTEGNNYFRLRQVDVDGTEKVYDPINVSCSEVTTGYFSSFPNPSGAAFQVIVNNKDLVGTCVMNIVDASGKVIEQRDIEVKDGINMFVINQELTPGMYFLNISNGSKSTPVLRHAIK